MKYKETVLSFSLLVLIEATVPPAYLQGVKDGEDPCKDCSVLIYGKQTKHPCKSKQREKN